MYAKIFQQIYDSSVCEDWQVMIPFQQLLILSNQDGVGDMTPEAISRCTNNDVADSRIASQCVASSRPSEAEAYTEAEALKASPPATKQQEAHKRSGGLGRKQKNSTSPNGSVVWDFYSSAYQQRYGVLPTRNQKVNSQLAAL